MPVPRWCSRTTTTWTRASTIRTCPSPPIPCSCSRMRPARRSGDAGMGHAADSEEAAGARRARHGARLGRAHERHQLRRVRAARRAGVVRRRTARPGPRRRRHRAERPGAPARAAGLRRGTGAAAVRMDAADGRSIRAGSAGSTRSTSRRPTKDATSTSSRARRRSRIPRSTDAHGFAFRSASLPATLGRRSHSALRNSPAETRGQMAQNAPKMSGFGDRSNEYVWMSAARTVPPAVGRR